MFLLWNSLIRSGYDSTSVRVEKREISQSSSILILISLFDIVILCDFMDAVWSRSTNFLVNDISKFCSSYGFQSNHRFLLQLSFASSSFNSVYSLKYLSEKSNNILHSTREIQEDEIHQVWTLIS